MMKIPNFTSGSSQSVAKLNAFWRGLTILFAVVFTHLSSTLAAEQPAGLIIYMEPPVGSMKSVEPIRFAKFQRTSVAYSDVVLLDGKTREIANGGILAFFQLPNGNSQSQQAIQQQAAEIVRKYPSVRSSVEAFLGEFHQLEAAAQKAQTLSHAAPASPATSQKFTVGGITYAGVSLESVGTDSAKIMHSDGVANLPLASLSSEQIAFLNTTSSTVHIDPTWADKKKLAEARKPTAAAATASVIPSSTTPSIPTGSSVPPVTPTRSKSAKVVRPLAAMKRIQTQEFEQLVQNIRNKNADFQEGIRQVNRTADLVQTHLAENNFVDVLDSIELKVQRVDNKLTQTLSQLEEFAGLSFGTEQDLFAKPADRAQVDRAIECFERLVTEITSYKSKQLTLTDYFDFLIRVHENGHDMGWRKSLDHIGSTGTDYLVKMLIYLSLIEVYRARAIDPKAGTSVHCVLDETGVLAPKYVRSVLEYAATRGITLITAGHSQQTTGFEHWVLVRKHGNRFGGQVVLRKTLKCD